MAGDVGDTSSEVVSEVATCTLCPTLGTQKNRLRCPLSTQLEAWQMMDMPETDQDGGYGLANARIDNPLDVELARRSIIGDENPVKLCQYCLKMFWGLGTRRIGDFMPHTAVEVMKYRRRIDGHRKRLSERALRCVSLEAGEELDTNPRIGHDGTLLRCGVDSWMRPRLVAGFAERARVLQASVEALLNKLSDEARVCNRHEQQVRHTVNAVRIAAAASECVVPFRDSREGLRALRIPTGEVELMKMEDV